MCPWSRRLPWAVLAVAVAAASAASAHVVYLKDGYAIYGKVIREQELIADPATGQLVPIVKGGHTFLLNDGARFLVFGQKQVERADDKVDLRGDFVFFTMPFTRSPTRTRPAAAEIGEPKPFSPKWERSVPVTLSISVPQLGQPAGLIPAPAMVQNQIKKVSGSVRQKITLLTPYFIRLECVEYDWTVNYLTQEFGPQVILPLVKAHPDVAGKPGEPPQFDRRFKVFRFCTQAGWLGEAQAELGELRAAFPEERQKLEAAGDGLKQLQAQRLWDDADLAVRVGRFGRGQELLGHLNAADLPVALQAEVANLKARLAEQGDKLSQARQLLGKVIADAGAQLSPPMAEAAALIGRELTFDTVARLEPFITVARQREQDARGGKDPRVSAPDALALAVTAWVLGPVAAEASGEAAERLWAVRREIRQILKTANAVDRKPLLDRLIQECPLSVPEVARLITVLPPPDGDAIAGAPTGTPLERLAKNPHGNAAPTAYRLVLPPEYHPNRAYPLLVVLPHVGEPPAQAMALWTAEAARRGYLLACPDWGGTGRSRYTYSADEQAAVLDCLRDVRRVAQVDGDRVFLTGFGEGANMAFDVGLSHPDQFAGVIPINGRPQWYASKIYWKNAQALPFYIAVGELTGKLRDWDTDLQDKWAGRGYGSLLVLYRGRTFDYFPGEVGHAFDWMERKRRATGFPELGKNPNVGPGEEFQTLRPTDNRFYWLSADQLHEKFVVLNVLDAKPEVAASFNAVIKNGNQVTVMTRGLRQITLWFGRAYDADGNVRDMIDLTQPVRIQVNAKPPWTNGGQPLKPSLGTLLEELHRSGDRQRLFFAKVEFSGL
jgi:dienelactone hydrolase